MFFSLLISFSKSCLISNIEVQLPVLLDTSLKLKTHEDNVHVPKYIQKISSVQWVVILEITTPKVK